MSSPCSQKGKEEFIQLLQETSSTYRPSRASIELELNMYLQTADLDAEKDPLIWWRQHEVAKLAKKYLCIPATSSPSERGFSASGNIGTCKRSCLKPERVDQLVFLSLNL